MFLRFLSLLLLFASPLAMAKDLLVCADPDNLPYSRQDESGFENAIARLVAEDMGAKLVYAWTLPPRGLVRKTLGEGLCDLLIGVPAEFDRVLTTRPYYRSSYVFVFRPARPLTSFDDDGLRKLRIGVQLVGDDLAATPPGHALAHRGAIDNVVGYPLLGAGPSAARIVDDIAAGRLDAALVWGPQAGYFAREKSLGWSIARAPGDLPVVRFEFAMSMGVRKSERALAAELDAIIARRQADIDRILARYAVPVLP